MVVISLINGLVQDCGNIIALAVELPVLRNALEIVFYKASYEKRSSILRKKRKFKIIDI